MNPLNPFDYQTALKVIDVSKKVPLPDWAASSLWLGAWCRSQRMLDKRLVSFAVLPSRELVAAFAAVGAMFAGAAHFEPAIPWSRFATLPIGSVVYWKSRNGISRFSGKVEGIAMYGGQEFISLRVTAPTTLAKKGMVQSVSQQHFGEYLFSEESPPTATRAPAFIRAAELIGSAMESAKPQWVWADGSDALLVTRMKKFETDIDSIFLTTGDQQPVPIHDLLCLEKNGDTSHAKIRITHPQGNLKGEFPLVILDGAEAFFVHEHLDPRSNVLVILNRSEYQDSIHNIILQIKGYASDLPLERLTDIPVSLPSGAEYASFLVDSR